MSVFIDACNGVQTEYTPIWLNRQAGRYMPEYHNLKGSTRSLDFFKTPELAAQATLDAQRILGVDAAIMFADLLPILEPLGLRLDYVPGKGPVFENPIRSLRDIDGLRLDGAASQLRYVQETIRLIRKDLPENIALIGFAGAPFTLAAYAIEGQGSQNFAEAKKLMYSHPQKWHQLLDVIADLVIDYVQLQIDAGVDAIQLFDSWIGCLSEADYQLAVAAPTEKVMSGIRSNAPIIYFGTGNSHLTSAMYDTGPDFLALDWRTALMPTWNELGCKAIQGNLDPVALLADSDSLFRRARSLLDEVDGRPGHIFNLGHGILPQTPVDNVKRLVDFVHEYSQR